MKVVNSRRKDNTMKKDKKTNRQSITQETKD